MFYCYECKEYLEKVKWTRELMGECCGEPAYDTFMTCPLCGSHDIEENVRLCDCCGEPTIGKNWWCEDCKDTAKSALRKALKPFIKMDVPIESACDLMQDTIEEVEHELTRKDTGGHE